MHAIFQKTTALAIAGASFSVVIAGIVGAACYHKIAPINAKPSGPMILAPMIGVIDTCILKTVANPAALDSLAQSCTGPQGSAAALLESTLAQLQPSRRAPPSFPMGYTLPVPLLQLFRAQDSEWVIDTETIKRLVRTVRDTERPLILYLFSTHFSARAPIEEALARNPTNLAQTREGPLPIGSYYGDPIYPWTFATTQTDISARRVQAAQALLSELCKLPAHDLSKIRGVTLLGELHHLFPDFEGGMGFNPPYLVTDYSPASIAGFQQYLATQFKTIDQLNRVLGAQFESFSEIHPPSRDIRTEPLKNYFEHIDSYAQGSLPIAGWAFAPTRGATDRPAWIHVYRNGVFVGKTAVNKGRQDVLHARPEFGDANTGWRMDMDFRHLPAGLHRISIFLERSPGQLIGLGERQIAIMSRGQQTPTLQPQHPLPSHAPMDGTLDAYIDMPTDRSSYYYNPLVPLWHAFRGQQVLAYLRFFDGVINQSCLTKTPRYTHQIIPFANPSWDAHKFAIGASLRDTKHIRLGVSLYGDATYGPDFPAWYGTTTHRGYGVTEFHPLKALSAPELQDVLNQHARRGAEFMSFFLEPHWQGEVVTRGHNMFSLDPKNAKFGSSELYKAMQSMR